MGKGAARRTELERAVVALEEALQRFERASAEAVRIPLDSQKNLERAARLLQGLVEHGTGLDAHGIEVSRALAGLRGRREASTTALTAWASGIAPRAEAMVALRGRFEEMAAAANALQEALVAAGPSHASVDEASARLQALLADAASLALDAEAEGFRDMARDAVARRDQLQAVAEQLEVLRSRLGEPPPH